MTRRTRWLDGEAFLSSNGWIKATVPSFTRQIWVSTTGGGTLIVHDWDNLGRVQIELTGVPEPLTARLVLPDTLMRAVLANFTLNTVVFDLDGVLVDSGDRVKRATLPDGSIDLQEINEDLHLDGPTMTCEVLKSFRNIESEIVRIEVWTARPDAVRPETEAWLAANGVVVDALRMAPGYNDLAGGVLAKESMLYAFGGNILMAFDDRPEQVAMYRKHGIPAICVH